ncbi:Ankyrin-1 [Nymphaea thermarum]|nr:Ankyrin-1 [Nymphaea thermarum]
MASALKVREKVELFLNAARRGDIELFKNTGQILDEEKKGMAETVSSVKDANGRTAFHFAAREGQTEICKFIVEELGVDVDIKDDWGETPLFHAVRQGHLMTAKYLLDSGADPSIPSTQSGTTPLHHAARTGNVELLTILLKKGLDVDLESDAGTPLIWAAGECQPNAVKFLLDHNANPNVEFDGTTPLLAAVMAGTLDSVKLLIEAGAKVNFGAGSATPLHVAADCGNLEIINCLLKYGADPNALDEDGWKPIQTAAARDCRDVVEILFPLTSPVTSISNWSIDGIFEQVRQATHKEVETGACPDNDKPDNSNFQKPKKVEVSDESKSRSLEAKSRGDEAFRRKDYLMAVDAYTQAMDMNPTDATLPSNRSLCWIRLGQAEQALSDAKVCRELRPDWPKGCYREGAALRLLLRFDEAADAFYQGVLLDPENKELVDAFREAVEAGKKFHGTG